MTCITDDTVLLRILAHAQHVNYFDVNRKALQEDILDIEDLTRLATSLGEREGPCPYFLAKKMAQVHSSAPRVVPGLTEVPRAKSQREDLKATQSKAAYELNLSSRTSARIKTSSFSASEDLASSERWGFQNRGAFTSSESS